MPARVCGMSTDTAQVDPQQVEETRQQIRGLVQEIAQLSKSEVSPEQFYGPFLDRVTTALAAIGGAVWIIGKNGAFELRHQINFQQSGLGASPELLQQHGQLLQQGLSQPDGMMVPPHSGSGDAGNPTEFLLLLGPLTVNQQTIGLVEVFQRHGAPPNTQRGYLRFLLQMCDLAGEFLKTHQLRHYTDREAMYGQLEQFTRAAHSSLNPRETSYTIVNEARRLVGCDRVTIALRKGRKYRVEAISGQDTFDKRSNLVRLLGRLATAVARTGDPVWYTGDTSEMAPQVERTIDEYVDESHSKTVAILPLHRPLPPGEEEKPDEKRRERPLGALIVEQIETAGLDEAKRHRVEVARDHSAAALTNALEHNSLFLLPLWRALGKATWVVKARTLPKTVLVLAAVAALVWWLVFHKIDFNLEGRGSLQPVVQRDVFAPMAGTVKRVHVRQGDLVPVDHQYPEDTQFFEGGEFSNSTPKDLLVEMESNELQQAIEDISGQLAATRKNIDAKKSILSRSRLESQLTVFDTLQLSGEVTELEAERASLQVQLNLLIERKTQLTVRAPRAASNWQVLTWDVDTTLRGRPVERGQVLMTLADPSGEWELEVLMPENRMGHVSEAAVEAREKNKPLNVTFILATDPETEYQGTVSEIHRIAEVKGEEGNTVMLRVKIDKKQLDPKELRPGAGVVARVECGQRAVGYVYLHEAIAWVYRTIIFRMF